MTHGDAITIESPTPSGCYILSIHPLKNIIVVLHCHNQDARIQLCARVIIHMLLEANVAAVSMEGFDFSCSGKNARPLFFQFKESLVFPFEKILLSSSGGEALLQFLRKKELRKSSTKLVFKIDLEDVFLAHILHFKFRKKLNEEEN